MMDFGRRLMKGNSDKDKDKDSKERAKSREKERKEDKKKMPEVDLSKVDWHLKKGGHRRSSSFSAQGEKMPKKNSPLSSQQQQQQQQQYQSPPSPTMGGAHPAISSPSLKPRPLVSRASEASLLHLDPNRNNNNRPFKDARTAKQRQKEKAFFETIAQNITQERPSPLAIAGESYKMRIIELEDEVGSANKRVSSLQDRIHMLEAEIRAAHDHHTRNNANLQEKVATLESSNAILKNNLGEANKAASLAASLAPKASSALAPPSEKSEVAALRQRIQALESELSTKTNDLAALKHHSSTLEPQLRSLVEEAATFKQEAAEKGGQVRDILEILGEWQAAVEAHDTELREYLADESEVPPNEEIRRLNKKVLLLRERVGLADQAIDRMARTVGVASASLELGKSKHHLARKEHSMQSLAINPARAGIRSNSVSERDAALAIKLAVLTMGAEIATQKLIKGIWLNTVRSVNLGGGMTLSNDVLQALSQALLVSSTVLSLMLYNTQIGDDGAVLIAEAMRGNCSITNLNLEECGIEDKGVRALAQALAGNRKGAVVALNLAHNKIGPSAAQGLATYIENSTVLTHLFLGYTGMGEACAPFLAQALRHAHVPLSHLYVSGNDLTDEGASRLANALSANTKLLVLDIQNNNITEKGAKLLAEALEQTRCHLQTLDLSRNPIGAEGAHSISLALKSNNVLKELFLVSCSIQTQGALHLASALEKNSTLHTLHLWGNGIGPDGLTAFVGDRRLGGLKTLDLRGNQLPPSTGQDLATMLSKKSSLTFLDLTGNSLGTEGCQYLAKALPTASLTSLSLSANSVSDQGILHIAKSLGPHLTTLSLSLNFLGDDAIDHLAPRLLAPSRVKFLDLSWNHIGVGGARELSKVLEANCPITTLNLEGNSLGPEGTIHISTALHHNTVLTHLTLAANNCRKDGSKALAEMIKRSQTLVRLNINKNGIKDDGAVALADALKTNTSLETLDLSENRIENPGISSISEALKLNSSLSIIDLSRNPFDRPAYQSLSQAHARNPKVHVILQPV